jgi:hypothetical protein
MPLKELNKHVITAIPVIEAISDAIFLEIIHHPSWQPFLTAASRLPDSSHLLVHRLLKNIVSRQSICPEISQMLLSLVLKSQDHSFIARFGSDLEGLRNLSAPDVIVIHEAICVLLNFGKNAEALSALLRLASGWIANQADISRDFASQVKFRDDRVLKGLKNDRTELLAQYALTVCTFSPDTLRCLNLALDEWVNSRKKVPLPVALFAIRIIPRAEPDEPSVVERFTALLQLCDTSDSQVSGELFRLLLVWITNGRQVRHCAGGFARGLFFSSALSSDTEKDFFRRCLTQLDPDAARDVGRRAAKSIIPPPRKKPRQVEALVHARRAAFLITDVWPNRKAEIISAIDSKVINAFSNRDATWMELAEIFTL